MKNIKPKYEINNKILSLLNDISQSQGILNATQLPASGYLHINSLANIDAVHYSTRLEGNRLTHKQVTMIITDKKSKNISKYEKDIKEVINYAKARNYLSQDKTLEKEIDKDLVLKIHSLLMDKIVVGKLRGYYRQAQNVIQDTKTRNIVYMPPEAADVPEMMSKLFFWTKNSLINNASPLIIAALFHYYFVTIHPFMDGNGRCSRLLTNFILNKSGFTVSRYASIEKEHEQNKVDYYKYLNKHQGQLFYDIPESIDLTDWLRYWLTCLKTTYIEAIERIRANIPDIDLDDNRLRKAYSLFLKHKRLRAAEYQLLVGLGRTQSVADLNKLVKRGLIKKVGGGRSRTYIISERKLKE
jgi:Fic family protein